MLISVFTPSHDTRFLQQAYESLLAQTYQTWEWVVLLNQGVALETTFDDPRVKVHRSITEPVIGALKAEAVAQCTGEILVELDHDDILLPACLQELAETFCAFPQVGFISSDFAQINEDGSRNFDEFDLNYGWEYEDETGFADNNYHICKSMSLHPHNLAYVWYAPNHVRAFRKSVYEAVGGYNVTLDVLDDLDLIARLYQATEFFHIPKNLYLQRVKSGNTQSRPDKNAKIQTETVVMYDQNIQPLMLTWAKRKGLRCLDLGGAFNPAPGYETVDLHVNADLVGDVFDILGQMEDSSVGVIRAVDFLEHISDSVRLMNEIYRVLAEGGMLLSLTPSSDGRGAFSDPTHVKFFNEASFWYFCYASHQEFVPEIRADFHVSRLCTYFPSQFHIDNQMPYVCFNGVARKSDQKFGGLRTL